MKRQKQPRKCGRCEQFTSAAMYLVRGREICEACGVTELAEWNALMEVTPAYDAMCHVQRMTPEEKRRTGSAGVLALCLVLGLAACSDDNGGGETVNAQGVQTCTVTVNGQEKPCH